MPGAPTVFVDANVLVYADDAADPARQQQAEAWLDALWARRCGRMSTQVLNEFYVVATRKIRQPLTQGDARARVRRYQLWQPWQIDHQTVETAWGVEARYGLNYWDALIVAAAMHCGASVLLTEDLQHTQQLDALRIVNPFLTPVTELFADET
jgi:predicted nucleic acid-binding protein